MLTTYRQELYPKRGLESVFLRTTYGDTRGKLSVVLPSRVQHRLLKFMGPFMPQTLFLLEEHLDTRILFLSFSNKTSGFLLPGILKHYFMFLFLHGSRWS